MHPHPHAWRQALQQALALALAAAVSLGLARFSYALLLPPMRQDLAWSYATAGAMNTLNAAGYLLGALLTPALLRAGLSARALLLVGGAAAALLLALHGTGRHPVWPPAWVDVWVGAARLATGVASAMSFVAGGVLAAQLAGAHPQRSGLLLGICYGGVGLGIVASALAVPVAMDGQAQAWPMAWLALGTLAALATAAAAWGTRPRDVQAQPVGGRAEEPELLSTQTPSTPAAVTNSPMAQPTPTQFNWKRMVPALAGYGCFGLGYIGYMTFVVSLLRQQGMAPAHITAFYIVLGLGVVASSFLWAGLLQRHRNGRPLAQLNALLAVATVLPVWSTHPAAVFGSGALFGSVFLSVVASTTALVRHNHAPAAWPVGIAAFTIVFAAGQIVGPSGVGVIADGPGGLRTGFLISAAALALGALLAMWQPALQATPVAQDTGQGH